VSRHRTLSPRLIIVKNLVGEYRRREWGGIIHHMVVRLAHSLVTEKSCKSYSKHMMNYAVSIEDLRVVRRGREVLHGLTASIPIGSITGLIGPSGCGKSTLMRTIVGVQIFQAGRVSVLGLSAGSPGLRRRIGYATQSPAVYSDLSVADNLRYFSSVLGVPADDMTRVMEEVGLSEQRSRQVGQLSGGQLSRVSLAVALLGKPEILILDEPTVGLDPVLREELWTLFDRMAASGGVTLLVSSHVMDEAVRCQQLILMRDGSVLAHESPNELCARTGAMNLEEAFLRLVNESAKEEN
jgi:ABC-2 type transport system ATP-binding protein